MTSKILVVDDEPDLELLIRQKFRKQIKESIYSFVFAHNGADALSILSQDKSIDILLTDINMPKMDGLTLLGHLPENAVNPLLKPIIVSAYGDMENIRVAMNRGAFDFIMKPIDFSDLQITLQKTIDLLDTLKAGERNETQLQSLNQELAVANTIQQSILPQVFPAFPDLKQFDLYASMVTAKLVGGDFYDFFLVDDTHLGVLIADVSGKGIPAALYMAVCRTILKATALKGVSPSACLAEANTLLSHENHTGMFVTVFYGILDITTGSFTYSNGGHNPPVLINNHGTPDMIPQTNNLLLGIMEGSEYLDKTITLNQGDTLFLYTDGITEAMNPDEEMYSDERLLHTLEGFRGSDTKDLLSQVIGDVTVFSSGADQSDDITCLGLRYNGA
jgi:phosphoserine phosphatase RsbU/P